MSSQIVIIPAYNEQDTIAPVISELRRYFAGKIAVINDGSRDRTRDVIEHIHDPKLHIINHESNRGYGASLSSGFNYAGSLSIEHAVTMDCDLQHEPELIPELFRVLEESGADIVSGSRYLPESVIVGEAPRERKAVNAEITGYLRRITGLMITDAFCGFKAYRIFSLKRMKLLEPGYGFPLELWVQAAALGLKVIELPVPCIYMNMNRTFGGELDNVERRKWYYYSCIKRACRMVMPETGRKKAR